MATERYIIEVQEKGTAKVSRSIAQIGQSAQTSNSAVTLLSRGLALLGGALGVRKLIEYADTVTNLRNRLNLVTQSTAQTALVTKELFDIAAETRSDFEATGQVYSRLALSAKSLGKSQVELLTVTKALNQAVILSGTNSREAANGLIQLSQAIAANRLGGDELRSVLEQLPLVADIIGAQLVKLGLAVRGTRGEVRQLGFEGKITAEIIVDALLNASATLEKQFAGTIPTIGQSLAVLTTRTIEFVAGINDATGATQFLAQAILAVARNIGVVARVVGALALVTTLASAVTFAKLLVAALGSLPVVAVGTLVALLVTFSDQIKVSSDGLVSLADVFQGAFSVAAALIKGIVENFQLLFSIVGGGRTAFEVLGAVVRNLIELIARFIDNFNTLISFGLIPKGALAAVKSAEQIARIEAEKRAANLAVQKQVDAIEKKRLAQAGPKAPDLPTKEEEKRAATLAKINAQLDAQGRILLLTNSARSIENDLLQIENQLKGKLSETERQVIRGKLVSIQQLQKEAEILDELRGPQQDLVETQSALNNLYEQGKISLDEYNKKLIEAKLNALALDQSLQGGLKRGLLEIQQDLNDVGSEAADALVSAFDNANDALADFILTGKNGFKDLENQILKDFTSVALEQLEQQLLRLAAAGLGKAGGGGGILGGLLGGGGGTTPGARNGADFVVGGQSGTDANLVAFRATRGERVQVTPPGQVAAGGAPVNVVFNIQTPDVAGFERSQGQILARTQASLERARRRNA